MGAAADGSLPAYGGDFVSSGTFLHPHGEGEGRQALAFMSPFIIEKQWLAHMPSAPTQGTGGVPATACRAPGVPPMKNQS